MRAVLSAAALVVALSMISAPAGAQWINYPTKGIPRLPDGKPNLSAPAPRTPDGKPDLSGIWQSNGPKYLINIAADLKPGEVPFRPAAEALFKERGTLTHAHEESNANCLPQGVPRINATPNPYKILQKPDLILILYEAFTLYRQIFMDGRELPKDPQPNWLGYSVGRWEGDALVVETIGFNGKTWMDQAGHPLSDALHVTERFRRRDFGHMELKITLDDPKMYTKPWTITEDPVLIPDTDLLEMICNENEKDIQHLGPKTR
jgi:hypothetical protein